MLGAGHNSTPEHVMSNPTRQRSCGPGDSGYSCSWALRNPFLTSLLHLLSLCPPSSHEHLSGLTLFTGRMENSRVSTVSGFPQHFLTQGLAEVGRNDRPLSAGTHGDFVSGSGSPQEQSPD